ncbi:hypothetical protein CGRA01v4_06057 [Colletotrichum graminicola]|nr:hypothetical protein CGRA01v4_06057 [Colletotrichum graminicola]
MSAGGATTHCFCHSSTVLYLFIGQGSRRHPGLSALLALPCNRGVFFSSVREKAR